MRQKIILLFANQYSIRDEETRELKEGITCNYYFNTELTCVGNVDGSVGQRPAKGSMPISCYRKIQVAPAIYDAEFDMKIGADGKPVLTIIDLDFVEEVRIVSASLAEEKEEKAEKAEKAQKAG